VNGWWPMIVKRRPMLSWGEARNSVHRREKDQRKRGEVSRKVPILIGSIGSKNVEKRRKYSLKKLVYR
jgi:hypothetical protein